VTPLDMALSLASDGIPVFPCRRPDKRPICPNGFYDATSDTAAVKRLWTVHPGNLIGVPTGPMSGLFAADIDSGRHASAAEWHQQNQHRLQTRVHRTESGGLHLLFRHHSGLRNSQSKLAHGVDTRGEGGYIIWWPAHVTQSSSGIDAALEHVPEWMLKALILPPPPPPPHRSRCDAITSLRGILRTVASASPGDKSALLFWGGCRMGEAVRDGKISLRLATDLLTEAALRAGWQADPRKMESTIRNGLRTGGAET
jgi:Bifunctional DNA primase/polymerase, N-terminal